MRNEVAGGGGGDGLEQGNTDTDRGAERGGGAGRDPAAPVSVGGEPGWLHQVVPLLVRNAHVLLNRTLVNLVLLLAFRSRERNLRSQARFP